MKKLLLLLLTAALASCQLNDSNNIPDIPDLTITVGTVTENSIQISWTKATDDNTPQDKLQYVVYYNVHGSESGNINQSERQTDIATFTITGLAPDTEYTVSVGVFDETDNMQLYGGVLVTTLSHVLTTLFDSNQSLRSITPTGGLGTVASPLTGAVSLINTAPDVHTVYRANIALPEGSVQLYTDAAYTLIAPNDKVELSQTNNHLYLKLSGSSNATYYDLTVSTIGTVSTLQTVAAVPIEIDGGGPTADIVYAHVFVPATATLLHLADFVATDPDATVQRYTDTEFTQPVTADLPLERGYAEAYIKVTAEDGVGITYYLLSIVGLDDLLLLTIHGEDVILGAGEGTINSPRTGTVTVPNSATSVKNDDITSSGYSTPTAHCLPDFEYDCGSNGVGLLAGPTTELYISVSQSTQWGYKVKYYQITVTVSEN